MLKIFDCSNSVQRPYHRGGGGPVTNDIMRYLKENAHLYDCIMVNTHNDADVIITNDVFSEDCLASKKPLVKRMDGVFWHQSLIERNNLLNSAAQQADKVIFISNYSKDSYFNLYQMPLKEYCVVHHWVDPKVFHPPSVQPLNKKFVFVASATDWNRQEKRYISLCKFAHMFKDSVHIKVIGKTSGFMGVPSINMENIGYIESPDTMASILQQANGFVNLTYKDAATKTIPQAISCGLPVFYANSGGVSELVEQNGVGIPEINDFSILDYVPQLTEEQIEFGYGHYLANYRKLLKDVQQVDASAKFKKMLDGYFKVIKEVV